MPRRPLLKHERHPDYMDPGTLATKELFRVLGSPWMFSILRCLIGGKKSLDEISDILHTRPVSLQAQMRELTHLGFIGSIHDAQFDVNRYFVTVQVVWDRRTLRMAVAYNGVRVTLDGITPLSLDVVT